MLERVRGPGNAVPLVLELRLSAASYTVNGLCHTSAPKYTPIDRITIVIGAPEFPLSFFP